MTTEQEWEDYAEGLRQARIRPEQKEDKMNYKEALEWLNGKRSMTNIIPQDPFETWLVRIAEADAAMIQQAYWIVKAHNEKFVS